GVVDQQQTTAPSNLCGNNSPFGQSFTPTASNIVAFDVNIFQGPATQTANFTIRQAPFTTDLIPPFPVTLVLGVNHIEIPGGPIPLTPGTKYGWLDVTNCLANGTFFAEASSHVYAGGALLPPPTPGGTPVEVPIAGDLYFKTYFLASTPPGIGKTFTPSTITVNG